ncbi:hypothetical protein SAICODRAFT_29441 [Saitoella complicata NRRL Y-17804]|uniref:Ribosomal protein S15 n=1 Tax=Saitoella complicata (strain BCRC 22490 / CBS 7301 / JCM 7358 / NBRC 10748 / NRRL Y-17804) TaxID=698492 RepID=A0A0E9NMD9_SAICN|nr:uncharacterized protein SAICODRAFT_29441 [Saitoella complicata NRRL Y-17804]ODQ54806.1 hypothetical protein SAICODRAFT_29441 [Saitoella complicata NRRL Y-17804]GAO50585.1 hypothetical protein G7K_4709-t1 [Saitoella complicata NRRL Y-17804]
MNRSTSLTSAFRSLTLSIPSNIAARTFSSTAPVHKVTKRRLAAIRLKKKNIARQAELKVQRTNTSDYILGRPTEFTRGLLRPTEILLSSTEKVQKEWPDRANFFVTSEHAREVFDAAEEAEIRALDATPEEIEEGTKIFLAGGPNQEETVQSKPLLSELQATSDDAQQFFENKPAKLNTMSPAYQVAEIRKVAAHKKAAMARILNLEQSNSPALQLKNIEYARLQFQRAPGDTGSTEVQSAILTARIHFLASHCKVQKKDLAAWKSLREMVHQRQGLLKYLRRKDPESYVKTITRLGLDDYSVTREITM